MQEITGNILNYKNKADAICVTTNGIIKKDGNAVMGAGVAKVFAQAYPNLPAELGLRLNAYGNRVYLFPKYDGNKADVISFPTKNHWRDKSNLKLIETSLKQLVHIAYISRYEMIILPRPGCANGGLNWEKEVAPLCKKYLDDRFFIIHLF